MSQALTPTGMSATDANESNALVQLPKEVLERIARAEWGIAGPLSLIEHVLFDRGTTFFPETKRGKTEFFVANPRLCGHLRKITITRFEETEHGHENFAIGVKAKDLVKMLELSSVTSLDFTPCNKKERDGYLKLMEKEKTVLSTVREVEVAHEGCVDIVKHTPNVISIQALGRMVVDEGLHTSLPKASAYALVEAMRSLTSLRRLVVRIGAKEHAPFLSALTESGAVKDTLETLHLVTAYDAVKTCGAVMDAVTPYITRFTVLRELGLDIDSDTLSPVKPVTMGSGRTLALAANGSMLMTGGQPIQEALAKRMAKLTLTIETVMLGKRDVEKWMVVERAGNNVKVERSKEADEEDGTGLYWPF